MKFRAKLTKDSVTVLIGICQTISKLCANTVILLTDSFIRIAAVPESLSSSRCFSELLVDSVFEDYKIESLTVNTILFELNSDLLSKALASGKHSPICQLKLVKRDSKPFLCFEAQTVEGIYIDVVHDIPITLMKPSDIQYYLPPSVPSPRVCLELPRGRLLKTIIDRLGKLAKQITITASQIGKMLLSVEHGCAVLKTNYTGLTGRFEGDLDPLSDADNSATVTVELKTLSQIFNLSTLQYSRAVLCKYCVILLL